MVKTHQLDLQVIKHGTSGFHIDPHYGPAAADLMATFFERCAKKPGEWERISKAAMERIESRRDYSVVWLMVV